MITAEFGTFKRMIDNQLAVSSLGIFVELMKLIESEMESEATEESEANIRRYFGELKSLRKEAETIVQACRV